LIYISKDVKQIKTIEKPKWSLNILEIILGIIETERKMRRHVTIQYRQPDFQTESKNRLKTNS